MPDIDTTHDVSAGFTVKIGRSPRIAIGNKALVNRFEITFLTAVKRFKMGDQIVTDSFGGDSQRFVGQRMSLQNPQSISASMAIAIDKTVGSLQNNQDTVESAKERIVSAALVSLNVESDIVYAQIEIVPEEYEDYYPLYYSLPLRSI